MGAGAQIGLASVAQSGAWKRLTASMDAGAPATMVRRVHSAVRSLAPIFVHNRHPKYALDVLRGEPFQNAVAAHGIREDSLVAHNYRFHEITDEIFATASFDPTDRRGWSRFGSVSFLFDPATTEPSSVLALDAQTAIGWASPRRGPMALSQALAEQLALRGGFAERIQTDVRWANVFSRPIEADLDARSVRFVADARSPEDEAVNVAQSLLRTVPPSGASVEVHLRPTMGDVSGIRLHEVNDPVGTAHARDILRGLPVGAPFQQALHDALRGPASLYGLRLE